MNYLQPFMLPYLTLLQAELCSWVFSSVSLKFWLGKSLGPVQGWDLLLLTLGGSGRVDSAVWALQTQAHMDRARDTKYWAQVECKELSSHGGSWEMGKQEQSSLC